MLEALREELAPQARRVINTGSLHGDLAALVQDICAFSQSEQGRGIMEALFIQRVSPAILSETRTYWSQRFDAAGEIVRKAIARGELLVDTPERLILELVAAPIYMRLFITREPVDEDYMHSVVEFVLVGSGAVEVAQSSKAGVGAF